MQNERCDRFHAQRGQTMLLVALLLVVLLGFAAFAADLGYFQYQQRVMQTAADSAALAGASELAYSTSSATAAAKADAASNGFQDGSGSVRVNVVTDYSDSYTGGQPAVQVQISNSYPQFFGAVFGNSQVGISARAVARMTANVSTCLYQLDSSAAPNFNGMTFNGPNCGIILNGTGNFNSATIDAKYIGYANGNTPNETGATFTEATPAPSLPAKDPCVTISGCNYLLNNPPDTSSCSSESYPPGADVTLLPGCYSTLSVPKATVTVQSGVYTFTSSPNFNKATLSGNATFYFPAGVCPNFNNVSFTLGPSTSGPTTGITMFGAPGAACSSGPNFNGSSQTLSGLVYFPDDTVNFNGSLGAYTVLVVGSINFNSSTQNFPAPPAGSSYAEMATLAE